MHPICPPPRSALWAEARSAELRQAVLTEQGQAGLADLMRADAVAGFYARQALNQARPALPAPSSPVVLPSPRKEGRHV